MAGKHLHKLKHEARQAFGKIRKGSSLTREKTLGNLDRIAEFAASRGLQHISDINTKFINAFVENLKSKDLKPSTIEGYLTTLRRLAHQIGKDNIVQRENKAYGIERKGADRYSPKEANMEMIAEIKENLMAKGKEWMVVAAELREAFGMRAKESLLSHKVTETENGNRRLIIGCDGKTRTIEIKGAKGGRPRSNGAENAKQNQALDKLKAYQERTGRESLIPENLTLKQALRQQSNMWHRLGGTKDVGANTHVARHAEVQRMISEGKDPLVAIERVGHSDTRKLSHYVHR